MTDNAPRILQYTYGGDHVSGIDTYLLEAYRALDKSRTQFDFLFRYAVPFSEDVLTEIEQMGAKVHSLGVTENSNPLWRQVQELVGLWRFLRRGQYGIVEVNMTALFMCLSFLSIARLRGSRVRILHAHDAVLDESSSKQLLKRLFTPALDRMATHHWACSTQAAEYLFLPARVLRGDWRFVKNSIDAERFAFDSRARERLREELQISNGLCVGMVGRFTHQKNHDFGLRILAEALEERDDLTLVLVGSGPLTRSIEDQADSLGVTSHVRMLGARSDIPDLMSAFDVLLAPSIHEGFPVIGLEAQAAGLPLVVSEAFPSESDISGGMHRLGLDASASTWARQLITAAAGGRIGGAEAVRSAGYDRGTSARELGDRYHAIVGSPREY